MIDRSRRSALAEPFQFRMCRRFRSKGLEGGAAPRRSEAVISCLLSSSMAIAAHDLSTFADDAVAWERRSQAALGRIERGTFGLCVTGD